MRSGHGLGTHYYSGIPASRFIKLAAEVHSYEDAQKAMRDLSRVTSNAVQLGANLRLLEIADKSTVVYGIELYSTVILKYYPDGTWSADNGGYNTFTTTTRLTQLSPDGARRFGFYHHKSKLGAMGVAWPLSHNRRFTMDGKEVTR